MASRATARFASRSAWVRTTTTRSRAPARSRSSTATFGEVGSCAVSHCLSLGVSVCPKAYLERVRRDCRAEGSLEATAQSKR